MTGEDLPDYYKILNVERTVDENALFLAYTEMVKKYALPPGASPALEHRREIEFAIYQKAYDVLSNPKERQIYDFKLQRFELSIKKNNYLQQEMANNMTEQEAEAIKRRKAKEEVERIKAEFQNQEKLQAEEKFQKAKHFIEKGNADSAIDLLKELVEKFPKNAQYHSYLGLGMQAKGWTGYSQAEFKVALHFNPRDPIALKYYQPSAKQAPKTPEKKAGFFSSLFKRNK